MEQAAKMFLNDERGLVITDQLKSLCTFNFKNYQHHYKMPFESLFLFNDEHLDAQQQTINTFSHQAIVVILPITGGLIATIKGKQISVEIGQILTFSNATDLSYSILNPNEERINFLHLAIEIEQFQEYFISLSNFSLIEKQNSLINFFGKDNIQNIPLKISIGQFNGREEATLATNYSHVFTYIITGAFEFQNRLLHHGDSLALTNHKTIELEALSNYATVLILQF